MTRRTRTPLIDDTRARRPLPRLTTVARRADVADLAVVQAFGEGNMNPGRSYEGRDSFGPYNSDPLSMEGPHRSTWHLTGYRLVGQTDTRAVYVWRFAVGLDTRYAAAVVNIERDPAHIVVVHARDYQPAEEQTREGAEAKAAEVLAELAARDGLTDTAVEAGAIAVVSHAEAPAVEHAAPTDPIDVAVEEGRISVRAANRLRGQQQEDPPGLTVQAQRTLAAMREEEQDEGQDVETEHEYRALLTCASDPCTYCQHEARTFPVELPGREPFATWQEAHDHGHGMRMRVYGSEHRVEVEARKVTPWRKAENPEPGTWRRATDEEVTAFYRGERKPGTAGLRHRGDHYETRDLTMS